jgi:hypothetical protein
MQEVSVAPGRHGGNPTEVGTRADEARLYEKVRALLRKAESTSFPAEAEALTAKAQDLLARYALDRALLDGDRSSGAGGGPVVRAVAVPGTYATGRAMLLGAVAAANRCTAVWDPQATTAMVVGYRVDLDAVEVLWTSLVSQAEAEMALAGPQQDRRGRSRTRSWRSAFWVSFAQRIGQRLDAQTRATVASIESEQRADLTPVLASRRDEVDATVREHFPRLTTRRTRVTNGDGFSAGRLAADRADLVGRRPLRGGA